jgi:hypothetical protein
VIALSALAASRSLAATVTVKNESDQDRPSETVVVAGEDIQKLFPKTRADHIVVTDAGGKEIVAQPIFFHGEKKPVDQFVFQADFAPNETKTFTLNAGNPAAYEPKVYGRWVPERNDDFAWENDRIAYRIYGPKLEIVEPGSSGVDVWCKSTRGLVVNKWYQIAQSINSGYYHIDRGEGLDCYKVGHSQGCGGTAIWADGKRLTTGIKGWKTQNVLANGPIRLMFELTYDPIDVNGVKVSEVKRVTLDAGHNLNHYECTFTTDKPMDNLVVMSGLFEHTDRKGEKELHKDQGWISYWDPGDANGEKTPNATNFSGHVGVAVAMSASQVADAFEVDNQVELSTKATSGTPVSFWAGAGWDKSGDFKDYADWNAYVAKAAKLADSPLKVSIGE